MEDAIHHVIEDISKKAIKDKLIREGVSKSEQALTRLADLPITRFNKSRLLIDGDESFKAIFEGIESAKNYILVHFFIVKNDKLGRELKSRLIKKAREKVRIYFLYDEIGCHKLPKKYIQEMENKGIVVSQFHTTKGRTNRFQINFRNHRKIVVIDGKRAYVGGHNVGDEYISRHPKFGSWRDTHLELEGPIVQAVQFCFVEDWYWAKTSIPDLNWKLQKSEKGSEETLMIASGPADSLDTCGLMFARSELEASEV
jgi:cardiolipin synthase